MTWHTPPLLFFPLLTESRCSSITYSLYPTFHYHNRKHAWKKKINSKRQRSQNPGFEGLIFIFLSCLLFFYVALFFSFRSQKWKETCLFFQPVPHYDAFQVCSFVWGQPRAMHMHSGAAGGLPRLTSTLQQNHLPLQRTPLPSVPWMLYALISVAKKRCQD